MAERGVLGEDRDLLEGKTFPLNSKRLLAFHIQLIAQRLGLPTKASTEELRQLIDGQLGEAEHEPQNVQVIVQEVAGVELRVYLMDGTGVFEECGPAFRPVQPTREQRDEGENELRQALDGQKRACEEAQIEVELMRERVAELKAELTAARDRAKTAEEQLREQPAAAEEAKRIQAQFQAEKERARQFGK